jgi:hypothetical protein
MRQQQQIVIGAAATLVVIGLIALLRLGLGV